MKIGRHLLQTHPDNPLRGVLWQDQRKIHCREVWRKSLPIAGRVRLQATEDQHNAPRKLRGGFFKPEGQAQWPIPHTERDTDGYVQIARPNQREALSGDIR
jgi:hypothetical protein